MSVNNEGTVRNAGKRMRMREPMRMRNVGTRTPDDNLHVRVFCTEFKSYLGWMRETMRKRDAVTRIPNYE